ncbi:uncharacterized protein LOC111297792 [Durio zibethinus]|uniref:Uncharacterized protein LOC111297792 n=1 Tax=Durio zibethinus TaxID=66656 RepID=A0A6P5Z6G3_DURZI|nr:uncharacterized protein LOC111297792 [Durio zibethinus]
MTRKKVKLAWIANDSARRASLKKRRLGLVKKVRELSTLCGTKACLIIYSPDESEPLVWPSHSEVQEQIGEFHNMPELERMKKMMNQETYLRERVTKVEEQLRKIQRRNKEVEMGSLMYQIDQGKGLDELNLVELHGLTWLVEEKMKEINKRIEFFQQVPFAQPAGHPHGDLPLQGPEDDLTARLGGGSAGFQGDNGRITAESLLWDQWFIDMINNNEFKSAAGSSSIRGDMGLPYQPFAGLAAEDLGLPRQPFVGSSSADIGLPQYGNFGGPTTDMGLPPLAFRPHGGASDMGLNHGNVGGSTFGTFGSEIGQGLYPFSTGSELGLPFGPFGGASSTGAGSDIGLPLDGKTWPPNNFSP